MRINHSHIVAVVCLAAVLLAGAGLFADNPPAAGDAQAGKRTISRKQLDESLGRGLETLAARISTEGKLASRSYRYQDGGGEALIALAALEAGGNPQARGLRVLLRRLTKQPATRTVAVALRSMVYARLGRSYRDALKKDLVWLVRAQRDDGGWGEVVGAPSDLFDSALAMIALGQADRLGVSTPTTTWDRTKQFLLAAQNTDGGYGYQFIPNQAIRLRGRSNGPATAAAAVMWGVLIDRKQLPSPDEANNPLWGSFARAARWLEGHFDIKIVPEWYWGDAPQQAYRYLLLLASPSLVTSRPEWSSLPGQLVALLLDTQSADGSWPSGPLAEDASVATAWAVLSLSRARQELQAAQPVPTKLATVYHPQLLLVIGRIHHSGDWNAMENTEEEWSNALAGAVSVGLKRQDVFAGQDYDPNVALVHLTGTKLEGFGSPARSALRSYLNRGGVVLVDPATGGREFFDQAKDMLEQMYGPAAISLLPMDDPILTGRFAGGVGCDVTRAKLTAAAAKQAGQSQGPVLWVVKDKGRIVAIVSRYSLAVTTTGDVSTMSSGESSKNFAGYDPTDAKRLATNILLYTYAARQQAVQANR